MTKTIVQKTVSTELVIIPDTKKIDQKAMSAIEFSNEISIVNNELYEIAAEYLLGLKSLENEIEETFDPVIKSTHSAWKSALAAKAKHFEPVEAAVKIIKAKMGTYQVEAEKRARLEQEEFKRQALEEDEKDRAARAESLIASGRPEEALLLLEGESEAPPVVLQSSGAPRAEGIQTREVWKGEVVDLEALVKAVAAGTAPIALLEPCQSKINGMVKMLGKELKIPGIRVYSEKVIAVTGR
jgi:hypothetical protein